MWIMKLWNCDAPTLAENTLKLEIYRNGFMVRQAIVLFVKTKLQCDYYYTAC